MRLILRFALNLLLRVALITVLVTLIFLPAQAEDLSASEIQVDTRLLCNTEHEAFRFVRLYAGDVEAALRIVNAEESNPTACSMVPVIAVVSDENFNEAETSDLAASLVLKSLVLTHFDTTEPKFRLLETTRTYAYAKLAGSKEHESISRRDMKWRLEKQRAVENSRAWVRESKTSHTSQTRHISRSRSSDVRQ